MPSDITGLDDEQGKTLITVRDQAKKAQAALATLKNMARWHKAPKLSAKLGVISSSIYQERPTSQKDILSRLPTEMQNMIWSYLTEQPDRLMLALTCKWNAAMYEGLKANSHLTQTKKISPEGKLSDTAASKSIAKKPRSILVTKPQRLAVLYRLKQTMKDEHPLMPKKYRLCYQCVRFLPRNYSVPANHKGKGPGFQWGGKELQNDPSHLRGNQLNVRLQEGHRCPDCVAREAFHLTRETKEYKAWKKVLDDLRISS